MNFTYSIKYMRKTNKIPKDWKNALRLWRIKKDKRYANKEIIFIRGNFYYAGILLQIKEDENGNCSFHSNKLYYKPITYIIEDY